MLLIYASASDTLADFTITRILAQTDIAMDENYDPAYGMDGISFEGYYELPRLAPIPQINHGAPFRLEDCLNLKADRPEGRVPFKCYCQHQGQAGQGQATTIIHFGPLVEYKNLNARLKYLDFQHSDVTDLAMLPSNRWDPSFVSFAVNLTEDLDITEARFEIAFEIPLSRLALVPVDELERKSRLCRDYSQLFSTPEHSDISFIVRGKEIKAHKCILASRSEYFSRMFASGMQETQTKAIRVEDFDAETFHLALQSLYSGWSPHITIDSAVKLVALTNKYQLTELYGDCLDFTKNNLHSGNMAPVIKSATEHNNDELQKVCFDVLKKMSEEERWRFLIKLGDDDVVEKFLSSL